MSRYLSGKVLDDIREMQVLSPREWKFFYTHLQVQVPKSSELVRALRVAGFVDCPLSRAVPDHFTVEKHFLAARDLTHSHIKDAYLSLLVTESSLQSGVSNRKRRKKSKSMIDTLTSASNSTFTNLSRLRRAVLIRNKQFWWKSFWIKAAILASSLGFFVGAILRWLF